MSDKVVMSNGYEGKIMDYEMFEFLPFNRKAKLRNDLVEDIKQRGQKHNIIVHYYGDKFIIYDGQHRFLALKHLELPVKYVIDNTYTIEDAQRDSETTKSWSDSDKVQYYSSLNVPICKQLIELQEEYPIFKEPGGQLLRLVDGYIKNCQQGTKQIKLNINKESVLRTIIIDPVGVRDYIDKVLTLIDKGKKEIIDGRVVKLSLRANYCVAFNSEYKLINEDYEGFLNKWASLKRNSKDKEIFLYMTSNRVTSIKTGIKLIYSCIMSE